MASLRTAALEPPNPAGVLVFLVGGGRWVPYVAMVGRCGNCPTLLWYKLGMNSEPLAAPSFHVSGSAPAASLNRFLLRAPTASLIQSPTRSALR